MSIGKGNFLETFSGKAPERGEKFTEEEWNKLIELHGTTYGELLVQGRIEEVKNLAEKALRVYGKEEYQRIVQKKIKEWKESLRNEGSEKIEEKGDSKKEKH